MWYIFVPRIGWRRWKVGGSSFTTLRSKTKEQTQEWTLPMPDRILDLTSGLTMVVSDLHGDKDAFARYVGRFLQMRTRKKIDRLLLLGDLIHRENANQPDESLPMLVD